MSQGSLLGGAVLCGLLLASPGSTFADAPSEPAGETIQAEAFIASPFADFFKAGDYPAALNALEELATRYPDDPLILRYRAIVLDRLGRYEEALALYDRLLARDPTHVPTRFFRAQTYYFKGERERAIGELEWTAANSPIEEYRDWSEEFLERAGAEAARPAERKRLYLFGNVGWEYDSNVILKSNDPGLGVGADRNAGRFPVNLGVGYRLLQGPETRLDAVYTTRQSFNDDSLSEFNFTAQELALDARRRVELWDKDVTLGLRYEVAAGFLDRDLFSVRNEWRLSADARLTRQTRTYLYHRFTVSDFGPDGSNPPQTSRDGFEYDLGATQYFYGEDFRRYVFVGQELNVDAKRGSNFDRVGTTTRLGLHVPVPHLDTTDLDASIGLRWGEYPHFSSLSALDPNDRVDANWEYYAALTHRWTPRVSTRLFYRYINANNRNDIYQYDRHIGGIQLLFTRYF